MDPLGDDRFRLEPPRRSEIAPDQHVHIRMKAKGTTRQRADDGRIEAGGREPRQHLLGTGERIGEAALASRLHQGVEPADHAASFFAG